MPGTSREAEPDRDCYPEKALITHRGQQQWQWLPRPIHPTSPITNSQRQNWPRRTRPSSFFFLFTRYLLFMDRQCISYPSFWKLLFSSDILRGSLFVGLKWKISASCVVCWEVAIWCETEAKRLLMDLSVEAVTLSPPSWH